ncbi:MAG TPA: metal ABC transporter permease [Cyanobacteria bacterium UBA11149]|nr:metal ABC transporter permease [Cyanobacteria bacterium UBA11367]HBE56411.1 metal ABC transporter permease [Cyanobacteria bacterium UBA11366]HBK66549.1 metal ABC transporter permease [Cyanobacteria bacterium UBA11166]HBR72960.1 metal ABC transporter permease [Cyanobacteria bacterium UBA11159]HBS70891.1 metal ABC transporter permease [Cyanobacteria bacterium UBA11153]HBW89259.1 metal ABC transporter permease [Cyanobacteria bacterium UBA11149]HCA97457.1 metal ABC transporter permease [Cyanob
MNFLIQPFQYEFFTRALLVAMMGGLLCGVMGVYITTRRMSYIAHGLSHAILGGAVFSYVLGLNFYIGSGIWGFASALLIQYLTGRRIYSDAAIGIVTTASFALGVAIISTYRKFSQNFEAALFGNVLGVTPADLWIVTVVTIVLLTIVFFFYKPLLFWCFDREVARVHGVPVIAMDTLFALMLATLLVVTLNVLGVTLIISAVVIPASIARLLSDRFSYMMLISGTLGAIISFIGVYLSYHFDIASGASVVLLSTLIFGLLLLLTNYQRRRKPNLPHI